MDFLENIYGVFVGAHTLWYALGAVVLFLTFGFKGAPLWLWSLLAVTSLVGFGAPLWTVEAVAGVSLIFIVKPIRRALLSSGIMKAFKAFKFVPQISKTERTALQAGVVWVEGDLFSGKPDFKKLLKEDYPDLTAEEQAFVDGPVDELCKMIDDWDIYNKKRIPKEIWEFLKKERFFGMIIPKEFGGLGFSALAHSEVVHKVNSRSAAVAITAMVPNSLGPAELLIHYGTQAQKDYYLPRLASGAEIPCFALTEPEAGSDAGSLQSRGDLFKGDDGKLYIKLNWNKRWITLAAVSTVLGLAFRLRDPENLLGKGEDVGITCALVPSNAKGVALGRRHDPMGIPFYNCPTQGQDVIVAAEDAIVGGLEHAGGGWEMLMESLGAGRGVSLPANAAGGCKAVTRAVSAHGVVRKQFGLSIGKFEGIEEPMARIASGSYLLEAMRKFTVGALDKGIKPPVVTAIAKYNSTEIGRRGINDAMDIMGGAGISRGPRNVIQTHYLSTPIGITVEGANILTRTLMIFGQGALRAHPYAFKEVDAIEDNDLKAFDAAFWGHIGHVIRNKFRSFLLSMSRGYLSTPVGDKHTRRYYRKLSWTSASFAIMADIAMGTLGGKLKTKEMLTGRFADILSNMYMALCVLRRYEAEGKQKADLPFVHMALKGCMTDIQKGFDGIFANLDAPFIGWMFRGPIRIWSALNSIGEDVSDGLTHQVSKLIQTDCPSRDRVVDGMFMPTDANEQMARLEKAFIVIKRSEEAERKVRKAIKKKALPKKKVRFVIDEALEKNIITQQDYDDLKHGAELRLDAIQVDDFSEEEYLGITKSKEEKRDLSRGLTA